VEQLRIILIILGILLLAGIWLAERIRRRRRLMQKPDDWDAIDSYNEDAVSLEDTFPAAEETPHPDEWVGQAFTAKRHDVLDDEQLEGLRGLGGSDSEVEEAVASGETVTEKTDTKPQRQTAEKPMPAEEVIVLTLLAQKGKKLRGPLLLKALQECGLEHGEMDIFHYPIEGHSEPLFSIANVLEPGRFVLSEMAELETPGIALFMRLPAPLPGDEALKLMLQKARQLGAQLNASLCDGQRQPLDDKALAETEKRAQGFSASR